MSAIDDRNTELKSKQICRFCLSQDEKILSNIYSRENRLKSSAPLPLQIMACVSIEVFINDGMPPTICDACRLLMEHAYKFKQMCKKADTAVRQYPLTGTWPDPLEKPKIPAGLSIPTLNAQLAAKRSASEAFEASQPKFKKPTIIKQETAFKVLSPVQIPMLRPKILNKGSVRILNKNAEPDMEPILSHPTVKTDQAGNVEIVSEIIGSSEIMQYEETDDKEKIKNAAPVETHVFPCAKCERSFPLRQLLDIHMVNHTRERSFECEVCAKRFFSKYDLGKHMLIHTGEKPFQCIICSKAFTRSTLLQRHERTHTDIPKFLCVYCEKPFLSQEELEKHTERHKKKRPFVCKICGKCFAFKQGLERHETIHSKNQPFPCQYCEQSFSTPSKLARHLTAHAGERPFPCKLCPKSYLLSHHLTRHLRSHNQNDGSYKCYDCSKTFTSRDDLIYHSAVHATKTLTCPLCREHFNDVDEVTDHIKSHSEGEQFACEFCDLIFMTPEKLQIHGDTEHSEDLAAYVEHNQKRLEDLKREVNILYGSDSQDNDENEGQEGDIIEEYIIEEYHEDDAMEENKPDVQHETPSEIITKKPPQLIRNQKASAATVRPVPQRQPPRPKQNTPTNFLIKYKTENSVETDDEMETDILDQEDESQIAFQFQELVEDVDEPVQEKEITQQPTKLSSTEKITNFFKSLPKNQTPKASHSRAVTSQSQVAAEKIKPTIQTTTKKKSPVVEKRESPRLAVQQKKDSARITEAAKKEQNKAKEKINEVIQTLPKGVTIVRKDSNKKPESKPETVTALSQKVVKKSNVVSQPIKKSPAATGSTKSKETSDEKTPVKSTPTTSGRPRTLSSGSGTSLPHLRSVVKTEKNDGKAISKGSDTKTTTISDTTSSSTPSKLVEMIIDDRKVKVQRIMMTKAQVAAMAKEGKIEMKNGAMILKQPIKKDSPAATVAKDVSTKNRK